MMDHICNVRLSLEFGQNYARIPLKQSPHIKHGDALELDWESVLPAARCSYVMGNPPFVGAKMQSEAQRAQVRRIADLGGAGGTLDYVAAWFIKAGEYISTTHPRIPRSGSPGPIITSGDDPTPRTLPAANLGMGVSPRIAFVATNSITQGEQVAQLWPILFDRCGLEIAFAHRTFAWESEARGKAHVHVVVLGLTRAEDEPKEKRLFSYDDIKGDPVESRHAALSPYLFTCTSDERHAIIEPAATQLFGGPVMENGNVAADGGHLILDAQERDAALRQEPAVSSWIHPFVGAHDLLHGHVRYCLWLVGCEPETINRSRFLSERLAAVRQFRLASTKEATRDRAGTPALFTERRQPTQGSYLAIPRTSSERREYIPISFLPASNIAANDLQIIANCTTYEFGILTSSIHMSWARITSGRLKSDIRYSAKFTYNTFPWPEADDKAKDKVRALAQAVLDARAAHPNATLADLYDVVSMPADLRKAHRDLDAAIDKLYRPAPFDSDRARVEHLFALYEKLAAPLIAAARAKRKRK
jgi:hypothetical protein